MFPGMIGEAYVIESLIGAEFKAIVRYREDPTV